MARSVPDAGGHEDRGIESVEDRPPAIFASLFLGSMGADPLAHRPRCGEEQPPLHKACRTAQVR